MFQNICRGKVLASNPMAFCVVFYASKDNYVVSRLALAAKKQVYTISLRNNEEEKVNEKEDYYLTIMYSCIWWRGGSTFHVEYLKQAIKKC